MLLVAWKFSFKKEQADKKKIYAVIVEKKPHQLLSSEIQNIQLYNVHCS